MKNSLGFDIHMVSDFVMERKNKFSYVLHILSMYSETQPDDCAMMERLLDVCMQYHATYCSGFNANFPSHGRSEVREMEKRAVHYARIRCQSGPTAGELQKACVDLKTYTVEVFIPK